MNFSIFVLIFFLASFAANASVLQKRNGSHFHHDEMIPCNATKVCEAPLGCFYTCLHLDYHIPHPPICDNFCVDKKLRCETQFNWPFFYTCNVSSQTCTTPSLASSVLGLFGK